MADSHDVLVLLQKPDNLNEKDTKERFNGALSSRKGGAGAAPQADP